MDMAKKKSKNDRLGIRMQFRVEIKEENNKNEPMSAYFPCQTFSNFDLVELKIALFQHDIPVKIALRFQMVSQRMYSTLIEYEMPQSGFDIANGSQMKIFSDLCLLLKY